MRRIVVDCRGVTVIGVDQLGPLPTCVTAQVAQVLVDLDLPVLAEELDFASRFSRVLMEVTRG